MIEPSTFKITDRSDWRLHFANPSNEKEVSVQLSDDGAGSPLLVQMPISVARELESKLSMAIALAE